ncbi:hypothetical protein AB1N83_006525 [Pleurotus pulmonarius]
MDKDGQGRWEGRSRDRVVPGRHRARKAKISAGIITPASEPKRTRKRICINPTRATHARTQASGIWHIIAPVTHYPLLFVIRDPDLPPLRILR